jgi:predicted membrane-bound dolichyl-phosphate-mannose-protein mannosyltransferase
VGDPRDPAESNAHTEPLDAPPSPPSAEEHSGPTSTALGPRLRSSPAARRLGPLAEIAAENLRDPRRVLVVVLIVSLVLRVIWLNLPAHALIFDETYYVNAARIILGLPASAHYVGSPPGLDPNTEHPPLGKLLIAGSMLLFGDNGIGWRVPSVIAAMVALIALYGIVRRLHRSAWLAVLVVALVSFDNLTFVHGRIGTLDILFLAPMLVSAWLALRRRWLLAGIAMGVALLIKLPAIYGIGAVLLYVLLTEGPAWWRAKRIPRQALAGPIAFVLVTGIVAAVGLTALDAQFSSYKNPLDHLQRMVSYGVNLDTPITTDYCPGVDSKPWQWIFNECQINYFRLDVTVTAGSTVTAKYATVDVRGALNPLLAAAIPLATLFALWYAWRRRSRLAIWAIAWGAANYLPYVALAIFTPRIEYLYYALPIVPAVAIAIALLLSRSGLPRAVRWGYLAAYAVGFLAYFPFRQIP